MRYIGVLIEGGEGGRCPHLREAREGGRERGRCTHWMEVFLLKRGALSKKRCPPFRDVSLS